MKCEPIFQETEVTLEPLEPSTTYQVLVSAFNDVGDGPASDKVIVETDPGLTKLLCDLHGIPIPF